MALKTLYQILLSCDRSWLRVIARQWDIASVASGKPDVAAELVDGMATGEAVNRMLQHLTPKQRDALDDVLRRGGALPWAIFVRRWGGVRAVGAGRLEREELWQSPESPAEALWFLGLVQRAFTENTTHPVEMAFIPEELMLYMPFPPPVEIPPPPETEAPPVTMEGHGTLADDLVTLWSTLQRGGSDGPMLLSILRPPAEVRQALLEALSAEQGWIRASDHSLHADAIVAWLRSDVWAQETRVFEAWRSSGEWQDVAHLPTLSPDPVKGWPTPARESRQTFLNVLGQCRVGAWYSVPDFTAYVKTHVTDFLRPDGDYETWAPRSAETGSPLRGFEAWDEVEGALVAHLFTGPLAWLGAIRLGGPDVETPDTFALTDAGAAWLNLGPAPELPLPPTVRIEPDGQIVVPARRRYERFQFSRIADAVPVMEPAGALYAYRLSPTSLSRARQQRIPYERIISFLEEAAGEQDLPDHLKTAIQRAYQREPSITLAHVWLLKVAEPRHLALPGMAELIETRLTQESAVIAGRHRDRVVALLAEHGVLVEIEDH